MKNARILHSKFDISRMANGISRIRFPVGAVSEAVNEWQDRPQSPPQLRRGGCAAQKKDAKPHQPARTGWCWSNHRLFYGPTPPRPLQLRMLRRIYLMSRPPLLG